ncbi:MAG: flagellar filament capping protein FliD [Lachnospiraceae bacterium]|nr:flagellar filament capping protein FliD [Lachnospiraceae bacterium]
MAGIRLTGLASGMDTQGLISQLSEAYQKKVDNTKKAQTKAEWKKTVWAGLNTKLQNFYKGSLSTFKTAGIYNAKKATGDLTGVKITAGNKAPNGTHKVEVVRTASAQMWTGHQLGKVKATTYDALSNSEKDNSTITLADLKNSQGYSIATGLSAAKFSIDDGSGDDTKMIDLTGIDSSTTVDQLVSNIQGQLTGQGVNLTVSFDNGKLSFVNNNAAATGDDGTVTQGQAITIKAVDDTSAGALGISKEGLTINGLDDSGAGNTASASNFAYVTHVADEESAVTGATRVTDLKDADGNPAFAEGTKIKVNGQEITIDRNTTLSSLATQMAEKGINANFDEGQGRFYLSSKTTGEEFTVEVEQERMTGESDEDYAARNAVSNTKALAALGLDYSTDTTGKIDAKKAEIIYNGVTYTQNSNTFNINGLTIQASAKGDAQEFNVEADVDGIYDKVKSFLKEYNSLLGEMNAYYNADSAKGYEPLTSEEKDAMSDEEVKTYEQKIKDSLLRRDDNLSNMITNFRNAMNKTVIIDGKGYSLSSFGINTGDWGERGLLHLDGDPDDSISMGNADKLKAAIASNPDAVMQTLSQIGTGLYNYMKDISSSSTNRSIFNFYDDKAMDTEIRARKEDVTKMQEKMEAEEDKYYKQFSAMETAMAKLQSQQTYLAGLFGG